ncbi:MAG: O-antigen ligase family protein [Rhodoferax sp.]|nr:O-antigen ligase family protein [Rhodoferax sp.]
MFSQPTTMTPINFRTFLIYFSAVSVALPIAVISISKILLFLCALAVIANRWRHHRSSAAILPGATSPLILLTFVILAASALWSTGTTDEALTSLTKHGKLLLIPIFLCLIRSRREALIALAFFMGGQAFLLVSTWMMYIGISLPWAISKEAGVSYAVFSSYLDQSIMTAVLAALCWHMRCYAPVRYRNPIALIFVGLALICVFFIFQGRTGHVVAIALISLAIFWEMPRKFRGLVFAIPFVMALLLVSISDKVRHGFVEISSSIEYFNKTGDISTSSGTRLNLWHRSLQSIGENPWLGTGVGSWNREFNRQEALHAPKTFVEITGNPHQEYLLWGVELGILGLTLFCAMLLALFRDSLRLEPPERRALQSILTALALSCMFNCSLYDALIGDFFCVALALLLAFSIHSAPPEHSTVSPTPST